MDSPKRILLVADRADDVELILGALAEISLADDVAVAHDGVEAFDYLYCRGKFAGRADGSPAVVMLDINTPRLGGLEVLRRIKTDPHLKRIPVVMFTSSCEESDRATSYELGVNAYVVKPLEFERFVEAVRRFGIFWALLNEAPPGHRPAHSIA